MEHSDSSYVTNKFKIVPAKYINPNPTYFRYAIYPDGSKVLQGGYVWTEGWDKSGIDWRDIDIVKVDKDGNEIKG